MGKKNIDFNKVPIAHKYLINYQFKIKNYSRETLQKLVVNIALPIKIAPYQIIEKLVYKPEVTTIATDTEGNHWLRVELPALLSMEERIFSYKAIISTTPYLLCKQCKNKIKKAITYNQSYLQKFLISEPHIESNHPDIVDVAKKLQDKNPLVFIKKAIQFLQANLKYELQEKEYGALYALQNKRGDCTEFSALLIALCRSIGIPARPIMGFSKGQIWERHALVECLISGRWLPIDPTNQPKNDYFLGLPPKVIVLTRGNWMNNKSLTKEVMFNYKVTSSGHAINAKTDFTITPFQENFSGLENTSSKNSPIIIEPRNNKKKSTIRILNPADKNGDSIKKIILSKQDSSTKNRRIELVSETSMEHYENKNTSLLTNRTLDLAIDFPDITISSKIQPTINIKNNSTRTIRGVLAVHHLDIALIRIIKLIPIELEPGEKEIIQPVLNSIYPGLNKLSFDIYNRIGRLLVSNSLAVSLPIR
ncbi:MAG: transglutaminase domain-containing protein [Promethearchaeota archaeon]|nr:MAG: transglutaminase domain-containing protein [Candidatus Lokiarchaeota archaeon]